VFPFGLRGWVVMAVVAHGITAVADATEKTPALALLYILLAFGLADFTQEHP